MNRTTICCIFVSMLFLVIPALCSTSFAATEQAVNMDVYQDDINITQEDITQEDIDYLIECQKISNEEIEDSMSNSLKKYQENVFINNVRGVTSSYTAISLGTDTIFTTTDWGDDGANTSPGVGGSCDSSYNISEKRAESASRASIGASNVWSWARVGKKFKILGSGGKAADITTTGKYKLNYGVVGAGSSEITVNSILWDATTGSKVSTEEIYHWSATALPTVKTKDKSYSVTHNNIYLRAGHSYIEYLEVKTSASALGVGEGWADAMTDSNLAGYLQFSGYTKINSIKVDFN